MGEARIKEANASPDLAADSEGANAPATKAARLTKGDGEKPTSWWPLRAPDPATAFIAMLALVLGVIQFVYTLYSQRSVEESTVSVARWADELAPDGGVSVTLWLAVSNTGTRNLVVTQAPILARTSEGGTLFPPDETALKDQAAAILIEPGKLAIVPASVVLPPSKLQALRRPVANDTAVASDGRTHVVELSASIVVLNPSGSFSSALTRCVRLPYRGNFLLPMTADAEATPLTSHFTADKRPVPRKFPCDTKAT